MKTLHRRTLAALGVVGVLAAGAAIPAIAQDDAPEITEDTTLGELRELHEERAAARQEEFASALAEELGLDADTVDEAITTVREQMRAEHQAEALARLEERLDEMVADGEITQEEADERLAAAEDGELRGFGRGLPGRHHRGPGGLLGGFDVPSDGADADAETTSA